MEAVLQDTRVSKHRLARIGCVVFDDLCSYLDKGAVVSNVYRSIRAAQVFSNQCSGIHKKSPVSTTKTQVNANLHTDIHVMCIVGSVGDGFCKFATEYLGGYWLYDLKNGTKQRIVGDGRTDAVRLEVDLESTPEIVNLSSGTGRTHQIPIEHSICKVPSTKNKRDRQYILECLVYNYLNLPTFHVHHILPPMLKKPRTPYQCIVFVANRAQQRQLSMLQAFRDISVRLGSDVTAEERARNLNAFREGTKPVMIASDASIAGCIFDNVRYVINYNPPKSIEIYRNRAGIAGKNTGSVCITLYNKLEYNEFSKILKALKKRVSIHTAPSQDYMYRYNAKWLERFANELSAMQPGFILPFEEKAKELLQTHDINDLFSKTAAILLGISTGEPISQTSILSERRGFTAVTVFDGSANARLTIDDIKSLVARQLPDINMSSLFGRYARTESGYIVDINSQYLEVLLKAVSNEPNICFEIARELPQLIMGEEAKLNRAKGHMSKLPWRYYKIRRLQMQKRML
uniref:Helicase C-terminal domain-containing protein n=2 Tax=Babesia bovis TaxID=5865 RepID=A7ASH7_BABBO|eukprot:XP_001611064.1 hypothetical protein [Babesia bovis T2Bo]